MPAQPQDHKTKRAKVKPFTFTGKDGETYTLPFASEGAEKVSGRAMRDAVMDGEMGEMKLGFSLLEACGADTDAVDALYDLTSVDMLKVLDEWMTYGDGDGASVPQS